ncbi:MAG: gamma-glutamylcyclotransferase family protein [Rhizomicrobium sp.]
MAQSRIHLAKPILYFAYGSNMSPAQMAIRCRGCKMVAVARLSGYRLAFFGHSQRWDSGEETVLPAAGERVFGVVYELSHSALDRLDAWQGVKLDGSGRYFHSPAEVIGLDGKVYSVLLYRKDILGEPRPPSSEYLAYILAGAEEQALPAEYIQRLRAIPSQLARYVVPRAEDADRLLMPAGSCAC